MHRGRGYRQILPRSITNDGVLVGYAATYVGFKSVFSYFGLLQIPPEALDFNQPVVTLSAGKVQWTKQFGIGLTLFTYNLTTQIVEHQAGMKVIFRIDDDIGGFSQLEWPDAYPYLLWGPFGPGLAAGNAIKTHSGLFGDIFFANWRFLKYSEEP